MSRGEYYRFSLGRTTRTPQPLGWERCGQNRSPFKVFVLAYAWLVIETTHGAHSFVETCRFVTAGCGSPKALARASCDCAGRRDRSSRRSLEIQHAGCFK
jgi:hypothetical protein